MKKKIVITGGHLTPALAVIEKLRQRGWEIIFIGRKYAVEGEKTPAIEVQIVPKLGIPFLPLTTGRIQRKFTRWTIPSLLKIPFGFLQAFFYLLCLKPNVVLSFGGYLSVPVVFSAWILRIPIITHEQTTVKGLATKFNSIFAQKIAVSWEKSLREFPKNKVVLTGNPIRKETFKINEKFWQELNFRKNYPLIFITGGNQGSHTINMAVRKVIPQLVKFTNVFHQCGYLQSFGDFKKLTRVKKSLPTRLRGAYEVRKYLGPQEMGTLLNKATLVVSRAGANTVCELAALGKPCILIPFPWLYQDEQTKNAQILAEAGIAEILPQEKLFGKKLLNLIQKMLNNISYYQKNGVKAKKLILKNAQKKIVDLVEEVVRKNN